MAAPHPALRIARATRRDVPALAPLIRGLAGRERLAHEIEAAAAWPGGRLMRLTGGPLAREG